MLIFFSDETYVDGSDAKEYDLSIYGGLVLKEKTFRELTDFIYELKRNYVFPQELEIKWRFETVWENMRKIGYLDKSITKKNNLELYESLKDDYKGLKEEVLNKISESDAKIIIAIRPNKLLNASNEEKVKYSIDAVARKFEKILEREEMFGIILADELPKNIKGDSIGYGYILNLCCHGSKTTFFEHLISIVPTIDSKISPIHQVNDILLGAVQYYILEFMRKLKDENRNGDEAKRIFTKIASNFYKSKNEIYTINSGILMYPPKNTRKDTKAGIFLNKLENQLKIDFNII